MRTMTQRQALDQLPDDSIVKKNHASHSEYSKARLHRTRSSD